MSEAILVRKILKEIRTKFPESVFFKIHVSPYQERGIPDIIGCHNGQFVSVEVKTPDKRNNTTKYQERQMKLIVKAGGKSGVATSIQEALDIIL